MKGTAGIATLARAAIEAQDAQPAQWLQGVRSQQCSACEPTASWTLTRGVGVALVALACSEVIPCFASPLLSATSRRASPAAGELMVTEATTAVAGTNTASKTRSQKAKSFMSAALHQGIMPTST